MQTAETPASILSGELAQHPNIRWTVASDHKQLAIEAPNAGGFSIHINSPFSNEWVVSYGEAGGHLHFSDPEEVRKFVMWCLSSDCRVREVWRGAFPQKSTLESKVDGNWCVIETTNLIFFPFWRRAREVVLQNQHSAQIFPTS